VKGDAGASVQCFFSFLSPALILSLSVFSHLLRTAPPPFSWIAFFFAFRFFEVIGTDVFLLLRFSLSAKRGREENEALFVKGKKGKKMFFTHFRFFFSCPRLSLFSRSLSSIHA
jgi:hypothetical protein